MGCVLDDEMGLDEMADTVVDLNSSLFIAGSNKLSTVESRYLISHV